MISSQRKTWLARVTRTAMRTGRTTLCKRRETTSEQHDTMHILAILCNYGDPILDYLSSFSSYSNANRVFFRQTFLAGQKKRTYDYCRCQPLTPIPKLPLILISSNRFEMPLRSLDVSRRMGLEELRSLTPLQLETGDFLMLGVSLTGSGDVTS